MNLENNLGLLLDTKGNITEIVNDSNDLMAGAKLGIPFTRLVASGSLAKALSFITQIQEKGAAFDWEFSIAVMGEPRSLHFTGGKAGDQILVVAAVNGAVALHYYEEMTRINNEQINSLRQAFGAIQRDTDLYDEISRLNNELVGMQRELAKKNAELIQINKEKNQFLGMAAHDLRNPLHSILLLSEFLLDDAEGEEEREFLNEIRSSSQFMAHLIDDLLDVTKAESGQLQLEYGPVDTNRMIQDSVDRNRLLAARKGIDVELQTDDLPVALIDHLKIEQVLNNLITNAVKFSTPGSRVEVRLSNTGECFRLEVQDWGTGIPTQAQANLFTPFQKGRTGTAGEKSSGLGLTIVKRIVEGHGGTLRFESEANRGTTFFVTIPYTPAAKPSTH